MAHLSKSVLCSLLIAAGLPAWGSQAPSRYIDDVFTQVTVTSNIKYGAARNASGAMQELSLDVYRPQGDTAKARPLFIFVHGGGFSGGTRTDGDIVFLCRAFAKKGYVTASFDYRLESPLNTPEAMGKEVVRAIQDGKAAVRFLRAKKADYGIDDSRIMMGGTSAGGVLSLDYAYLDGSELPSYIDTAAIGGVEGSSGTPGISSEIRGIMNCYGGIGDSTILKNARLPAISFHGTVDNVVPYDIGSSLGNPALKTFGSACIHRNLTRFGVKNVLKPFVGMGHGFPGDAKADTIVVMTAKFAYEVLFAAPTRISPREGRNGTLMALPGRVGLLHPALAAGESRMLVEAGRGRIVLVDGRQSFPARRLPAHGAR